MTKAVPAQVKEIMTTMRSYTPSLARFSTATILTALLPFLPGAQAQDSDSELAPKAIHGTIQQSLHNQNGHTKPGSSSGIYYHGGPLLATASGSSVHVYVIWYGNWSGNTATTIIPNFLNAIGGSPYFKINTSYYNGAGAHVQNAVEYLGFATDNYSQGTSLGDAQIQAI